jgi:hypothetical protein
MLEAQLKALQEALVRLAANSWPGRVRGLRGRQGNGEVKCGLVRPDDRNGVADVARKASEVDGDESLVAAIGQHATRALS